MPQDTQLAVLQRIEGHLKKIADNGERIAAALEKLEKKTPNADGTA